MIVLAASTGKVALIVLVCIVVAVLFVLRWNYINRKHDRRVAERADREHTP